MSQNAEILRRAIEHINRTGSLTGTSTTRNSCGRCVRMARLTASTTGSTGFVRASSLSAAWNQMLMEIVEVIESGEAVVVVLRERLRANSGVELELTEGWAEPGFATASSSGSSNIETRRRPSRPPGSGSRRVSKENVEIVRRMWDAWQAGDVQSALLSYDPGVEWDGTNLPDGDVAWGHEVILDHIRRWADQWDDWTVEVERIADAGGEQVVLFMREQGRSKSGLAMDERHAELYTYEAARSGGRASPPQTKPWKLLASPE